MPLFRKAWEAFPDDRSYMFGYVRDDEIWQMPEMYDYAREALIPKPGDVRRRHCSGTRSTQVLSYGADGRIDTVVSRLLDLAASQGKLDELSAQVDAARKAMPHWTAGDVAPGPDRLPARPLRPGQAS